MPTPKETYEAARTHHVRAEAFITKTLGSPKGSHPFDLEDSKVELSVITRDGNHHDSPIKLDEVLLKVILSHHTTLLQEALDVLAEAEDAALLALEGETLDTLENIKGAKERRNKAKGKPNDA